jgi:hypothetical protein
MAKKDKSKKKKKAAKKLRKAGRVTPQAAPQPIMRLVTVLDGDQAAKAAGCSESLMQGNYVVLLQRHDGKKINLLVPKSRNDCEDRANNILGVTQHLSDNWLFGLNFLQQGHVY